MRFRTFESGCDGRGRVELRPMRARPPPRRGRRAWWPKRKSSRAGRRPSSLPEGISVTTADEIAGASARTIPAASLSPRTARQATTGLSPISAWSASASAAAPSGLCAASRITGGSPSMSSKRPGRSRLSRARSTTSSPKGSPTKASAAAIATARFRRRYGARERNVPIALHRGARGTFRPWMASTTAQSSSAASARASSATSGDRSPVTSVVPGRRTASFSAAISSSVSPSHCVWSRPIEVRTVTFESRTFVASRRPPRPASITPTSTPASRSATNAAAVAASNCVTRSPSSKPLSTSGTASATAPTARSKASAFDLGAADRGPAPPSAPSAGRDTRR